MVNFNFNQIESQLKETDQEQQAGSWQDKATEYARMTYAEFNHVVGEPKHPSTLQPSPMMPWQVDFDTLMAFERAKRQLREPLKVHDLKSRQIGFTEHMQRFLVKHGFDWYAGKKIINIAGTREKTAKKIQHRLRALFNNIENQVADEGTDLWFKLKNGTEYEALPSNIESIRGETKVGAVAIDEAAYFEMVDDHPVIDAVMPIVDTNIADLFAYSTGNGPSGFFYDLDMAENDFIKLKHPIFVAKGYLFTEEQIQRILKRTDVDVEQEYLCRYTAGRKSIFGDEFKTSNFEAEVF